MIRVLHIVTYMGRGGLETMLMNYYRHMDRQQVQFDFLVHREFVADYDEEILSLGGKIYRFPRLVPWSRSYRNKLTAFLREHREYRIVHVHQDCLSAVALECAKDAGVPVRIAHSHNANQDRNLKYLIKLWYKPQILRYATDLIACGVEAGNWMFDGAKYLLLGNAINAKVFQYDPYIREWIREELGLGESKTIGLVARFSPQKNHTFLLDIFQAVAARDQKAKLLLVGDGPLRQEIEDKIHKLHLDKRVVITGVREDVEALLQAMDVFVMPSLYEGLPLSVVEAQAAGLPCILSDAVPASSKITDLVQQLSLKASPEQWADVILCHVDTPRADMYDQIVRAGFDIGANGAWLQEFYLQKGAE